MPKDQGKNNKQNLQLNIQMFVCYEAKQPHILESGVAWRWVDKTSGWQLEMVFTFHLAAMAPFGACLTLKYIWQGSCAERRRLQGVVTKEKQRQFLSQTKYLYPTDRKDFFRFIGCLIFSIFSIRAKAQKRLSGWLEEKASQSPFLCLHQWAKMGKWCSHFTGVFHYSDTLSLLTVFVSLLPCRQVGHGLQPVEIATFQRRKAERQLVRNKP